MHSNIFKEKGMNPHKLKKILLIAGLIELIAGLSHAFMPHFIYKSSGFSFLQPNEINVVTCCIFSVGILLVAFGTITIICALKYHHLDKLMMYYFFLTKSALWTFRTFLELMFPTEVSMFSITRPSFLLIPSFIFIDCLFILSVFLIRTHILVFLLPDDARFHSTSFMNQ